MKITTELLDQAKTEKGGFTKKQVNTAQKWTGKTKGWKEELLKMQIAPDAWDKFVNMARAKDKNRGKPKQKKKKKPVNKMTVKHDQFWKPEARDIPKVKDQPISRPKKFKTEKKRKNYELGSSSYKDFYWSKEWRKLRLTILEKYECKCMMCGRSPRDHKVVLHVDHIKPRSKFPEFALTATNLQILCEDCNLGKSNRYETDWRPDDDEITKELDTEILESLPVTML